MRYPAILAVLLLGGTPVLAATPAALQAEQNPTMPGDDGPRHGGRLAGFFTPEQRIMFAIENRDQLKAMSPDQRRSWRRDEIQKVMAMSDSERAKLKADLQAKYDALPQTRKDRIQQRLARGSGGRTPAQ